MAISLLIILLAAFLVVLSPEKIKKIRGWILAVVPGFLFVYFLGVSRDLAGGITITEFIPWMPGLGIDLFFFLDSLSLLFVLLITGIGTFIFIYAGDYMKSYPHNRRFFFYILLFLFSMFGLVTSGNLIVLFVFWELTSISSFFLIGFFSDKKEARGAAIQALLVTGLGGLAMLSGIILIGKATGSYNINEIIENKDQLLNSKYYLPSLLLVLAGAFTKSAQFPFHFWLPGAMQAPSPVSAFLHSATMVKAGIYLILRVSPFMANTTEWEYIVSGLGAATMFVGAYMAISKN
jgi:multicomponent Na+:H+ antiporter subunit A